jgi:hypothetical protein
MTDVCFARVHLQTNRWVISLLATVLLRLCGTRSDAARISLVVAEVFGMCLSFFVFIEFGRSFQVFSTMQLSWQSLCSIQASINPDYLAVHARLALDHDYRQCLSLHSFGSSGIAS